MDYTRTLTFLFLMRFAWRTLYMWHVEKFTDNQWLVSRICQLKQQTHSHACITWLYYMPAHWNYSTTKPLYCVGSLHVHVWCIILAKEWAGARVSSDRHARTSRVSQGLRSFSKLLSLWDNWLKIACSKHSLVLIMMYWQNVGNIENSSYM